MLTLLARAVVGDDRCLNLQLLSVSSSKPDPPGASFPQRDPLSLGTCGAVPENLLCDKSMGHTEVQTGTGERPRILSRTQATGPAEQ